MGQHYTRGSQTVMPPIFYFVLFKIWTCEHFIEIHYFMADGIDVFHSSLYVCQQSSSTTQPPLKWVQDLFNWGQAARVWHCPPNPF